MNLLVLKGFEAGKKRLKGLSWASWLCVHGVETEISRISVIWKNMRHDCFAFNKVSVPYGYGMFCFHFPFWFVCLFVWICFIFDKFQRPYPKGFSNLMQYSWVCKINWRFRSLQWDIPILTGEGEGQVAHHVSFAAWSGALGWVVLERGSKQTCKQKCSAFF